MKRSLLITIVLIFAFLMAACSDGEKSAGKEQGNENEGKTGEPKQGGTILVGVSADPMDFNPNAKGDDNAFPIHQNLYNRLMKITNKQEIVPDLAKEYEVSNDGKEITFHLNEGVTWHDGEKFSSEDVKFTFDTIISEKGQASGSLTAIDEITAPDENTVVFQLSRPDSSIIGYIAWYGTFIMPKHIYEGTDWNTNPANQNPIGTGPFKFVEHNKGVNITLERNDDYWGDIAYLDKVIYSVIPDSNTAIQALLNEELDILGISPPFSEMEGFKTNPQLSYGELVWPSRFQIAFNQKDKNFSDLKVRQAVAYGLDKQEIIDKALKGAGSVSKTAMVPAYEWAVNNTDLYPDRDIEKAKQLLEEAGYEADSNGVYFSVTFDVFSMEPFGDIGTVVKENLKDIGIDVKLNLMEYAAWDEKVWTGKNYEIALLAGYQGPGPGGLNGRFASDGSMNIYNYANDELDENLLNASVKVTEEERAPFYQEAQRILIEDLPMVPISEWMMVDPFQAYIKGHPMSEEAIDKTGFYEYTYLWIDK